MQASYALACRQRGCASGGNRLVFALKACHHLAVHVLYRYSISDIDVFAVFVLYLTLCTDGGFAPADIIVFAIDVGARSAEVGEYRERLVHFVAYV